MPDKNKKTNLILWLGIFFGVLIVVLGWAYIEHGMNSELGNKIAGNNQGTDAQDPEIVSEEPSNVESDESNFDTKGQTPTETPVTVTPPTPSGSTDPYYYYNLGKAEYAKNNLQSAIDNFDQAIAINSTNSSFYIAKSEAQISLGQKAAALDTINFGLSKMPDDESLLSQLDFIQNVVK